MDREENYGHTWKFLVNALMEVTMRFNTKVIRNLAFGLMVVSLSIGHVRATEPPVPCGPYNCNILCPEPPPNTGYYGGLQYWQECDANSCDDTSQNCGGGSHCQVMCIWCPGDSEYGCF